MAKVKELVSAGAPLLGAVLGGPPGLAAGAISLVTNAMGIPSNSSVQDIAEKIRDSPEVIIKLRELEFKYQQYLLSLKLQMDQAENADRADARARELGMVKTTGKRDWFVPGLGGFVVLGFTLVLCFMVFRPQQRDRDESTSAIINILVGALTAGYSTVLSYYFGSSRGSKNKDGTIASLTQSSESLNTSIEPFPTSLLPAPAPTVQRKTLRDK